MTIHVIVTGKHESEARWAWTDEDMAKRCAQQWSAVNGGADAYVVSLDVDPDPDTLLLENIWAPHRNKPFDPRAVVA